MVARPKTWVTPQAKRSTHDGSGIERVRNVIYDKERPPLSTADQAPVNRGFRANRHTFSQRREDRSRVQGPALCFE